MKDFVYTGLYLPTMTTVDDPLLQVIEVDNGISWSMKFYVGDKLIDCINLESPIGDELDANVLDLPVYEEWDENHYKMVGTVRDRLKEAIYLKIS
jgi:hypothetical protein